MAPGAFGTLPTAAIPPAATASPPAFGSPSAASRFDVLPILERGRKSIWARVATARDQICETFEKVSADLGFEAMVIKSGPFVQPAWVRIESWMPKDGRVLTDRRWVGVDIHAKEFHRYELEYTVTVYDRGWSRTFSRVYRFDSDLAADLVRFVLDRGPRPLFTMRQVRQNKLALWMPLNKIDAVSPDWFRLGAIAVLLLGLATFVLVFGLVFVFAAAIMFFLIRRRRYLVRSSGKPDGEPRTLVPVDSWQAVISGLGTSAEPLRSRFMRVAKSGSIADCRARMEQIWHWGLDGKVEREQIALTLRRAMIFCQIYHYGDELYVGWDAHLNRGQWVETTVVTGIDRQAHVPTRINTVIPGVQPLSEYDVTDVNCLIEWTHAKLVSEVKRLMEERHIDQEVDFTILRGERQGLTRETRPQGVAEAAQRSVRRLGQKLLRVA